MATDPHAWQPGDRVLVEAQIRGDGDVNVLHVDGWALDFFPRDAVKIHPAAPAGTGSPTPADAPAEIEELDMVLHDLGNELHMVVNTLSLAKTLAAKVVPAAPYVRALGELRIALLRHGVDITVDTDRVAAVAIETLDNLRAELSQVQKERDALRAEIRSHRAAQVALMAALDVEGKPEEVADVAIRDRNHLRQTFDRVATERDEARSALAALRAEVGKIADRRERERPDDIIVDALRALVTDQSPAAPPGPTLADVAPSWQEIAEGLNRKHLDLCRSVAALADQTMLRSQWAELSDEPADLADVLAGVARSILALIPDTPPSLSSTSATQTDTGGGEA